VANPATLDIDKEIRRRQTNLRNMQVRIDQDELARREADVESGQSKLISPDEFWDNVKKGYKLEDKGLDWRAI
jgi:hypothetical protein